MKKIKAYTIISVYDPIKRPLVSWDSPLKGGLVIRYRKKDAQSEIPSGYEKWFKVIPCVIIYEKPV